MLRLVLKFQICGKISAEGTFAFMGLFIVFGVLRTGKKPVANLWTTNAVYAGPIFHATIASDLFFQFYAPFDDKTTSNQRSCMYRSALIRDAFESIISRFQMTLDDQVTIDKQLVVFRSKCPFCVFIISKLRKYGINL